MNIFIEKKDWLCLTFCVTIGYKNLPPKKKFTFLRNSSKELTKIICQCLVWSPCNLLHRWWSNLNTKVFINHNNSRFSVAYNVYEGIQLTQGLSGYFLFFLILQRIITRKDKYQATHPTPLAGNVNKLSFLH